MRQRAIAATYIKEYLQCLQKFYFRYFTDKKPPIFGDARPFGIAIHSALEYMYSILSETNNRPTSDDYDAVITRFIQEAVKNNLVDQALYDEGRMIIKRKLDLYDPAEKVLGLEFKFGLPPHNPEVPVFTTKGTPIMGAIDKIFELNPETLVIVDYKTSRTAMTPEEAAVDVQLSMYDLVANKLFPGYKNIIIVLDYLRLEPVMTHRNNEQRKYFEQFLDELYIRIGELKEEDIKPRLNELCGWCDHRSMCPAYVKAISDPDLLIKPPELMSDTEFTNEWVRFTSTKKAMESHKRSLEMHAANMSNDRGSSDIVGEEYSLYRTQSSRVDYDARVIAELVPKEAFISMVSVNKSELNRYMANHPEISKELSKTAKVNFSSSYFRTKKNK